LSGPAWRLTATAESDGHCDEQSYQRDQHEDRDGYPAQERDGSVWRMLRADASCLSHRVPPPCPDLFAGGHHLAGRQARERVEELSQNGI